MFAFIRGDGDVTENGREMHECRILGGHSSVDNCNIKWCRMGCISTWVFTDILRIRGNATASRVQDDVQANRCGCSIESWCIHATSDMPLFITCKVTALVYNVLRRLRTNRKLWDENGDERQVTYSINYHQSFLCVAFKKHCISSCRCCQVGRNMNVSWCICRRGSRG